MEKIFIDSGGHGLYNDAMKPGGLGYAYYDTTEFYEYVDRYAQFVLQNLDFVFAPNVDAIFNPEKTWEIQHYIEEKWGFRPVPVVHYGADLKWLHKYLAEGHDIICFGGPRDGNRKRYIQWADRAWAVICDTPDHLPRCKVHGFAATALSIMQRYPWYSVDSATWVKLGGYGKLVVPSFLNGKWAFDVNYNIIKVTNRVMSSAVRPSTKSTTIKMCKDYCKYIGIPFGKSEIKKVPDDYILQSNEKKVSKDTVEIIIEKGVINDDKCRTEANSIFFVEFAKTQPKWPWPFNIKKKETLL